MYSRSFRLILLNIAIAALLPLQATASDYDDSRDNSVEDVSSLHPVAATPSRSSLNTHSAPKPLSLPRQVMESTSPIIGGTVDNDPRWWKSSERFEIFDIQEYNEQYGIDDTIVFYVIGKSDQMDVTQENGFYMAGGLHNLTDNAGYIASVKYISDRHAWQVKIAGQRDRDKQYQISMHLVCGGGNNSPCATVYGNGATINKILAVYFQ